MQHNDVNVSQIPSGSWLVDPGTALAPNRVFKKRDHAIAWARALAFSTGVRMFIHGPDGIAVLQAKESLTYPLMLD
jgi:hypothetical protein